MRSTMLMGLAVALTLAGCGGGGAAGGGGETIALTRDAKLGAKYGAAGPRSCNPRNAPVGGPPSTLQAASYVICGREGEMGSNLYLLANTTVSAIAPGRAYNMNEDINMGNIDANKPVYAIRGSTDAYQCSQVVQPGSYDGGINYRPGHNCSLTHERQAQGLCYLDTFGEWHCSMVDTGATINEERGVGAPG